MLCLYSYQHNLLLTFTILKQWIILLLIWETAKYSYPCMYKYYRKGLCWKKCGAQFRHVLFMFRWITLAHLNSLASIYIFSCLGSQQVNASDCVAICIGFKSRLWQECLCLFFLFCCCCVHFFVQNTLFVMKLCTSFWNVNLFSIPDILQNVRPIVRISRYRSSLFNVLYLIFIWSKSLPHEKHFNYIFLSIACLDVVIGDRALNNDFIT